MKKKEEKNSSEIIQTRYELSVLIRVSTIKRCRFGWCADIYDCIVRYVIMRKLGESEEDRNQLLKVVQQTAINY